MTFADKIIHFNTHLEFHGTLPGGIRMMNPYRESETALVASTAFYRKYYDDRNPRHLILGINPGRFGSGTTGVSFTDPKRLAGKCGIPFPGPVTHEPSSEFIYDMIDAYGGPEQFYQGFYIHSVCPLGLTIKGLNGKETNYNYYDSKELQNAVMPFILDNIHQLISMGFETDVCFCFGTGKNESFLRKLNAQYGFFGSLIALEHPRFIMQYKSKFKQDYIAKYLEAFSSVRKEP